VAETGDNEELTRLFTKVGRIQFMIMMLILSGFIFFGRPFIYYWAGTGYEEAYAVALLLIVPVTVPLIQNLGIEIQRAKNKHKARAIVYLLIAVANVFLSIPLIRLFGPAGAALGTALSLLAGNILFMNWYYHTRIEINMFYFWKNIAHFIPALCAPVGVGILCSRLIRYDSLVKLATAIGVYTVVYAVSMYLLGFNDEERQMCLDIFSRVHKK